MDLRIVIQNSLSADPTLRQQAELNLKSAEQHPGFIGALLDIVQAEQDPAIRLSTAIYLKNRISRAWPTENPIHQPISEPERKPFRDRLLPVLSAATPQVRAQLVAVLQSVLHEDYPKNWPEFLDITVQLLNTQDANSIFAGLQCLLAICRTYRFKLGEDRARLEHVVEITFPILVNIGTKLVEENSLEAGEMLRIVVKCYKHTVYYELCKTLQTHQATVDWCTLFLRVISKQAPECAMMEDLEEREQNHWWKAKKWSYANLNRLWVRYGNPNGLSQSSQKEYDEFSKNFITNFAPEILKGYLAEIEKWVSGTHWLNKPALSYTLIFLEECVKPKSMWDNLKPHMDNLIKHLIFPVLCQSDEDIELFSDDPAEYLHRKLNFYEEISAPDMAATNFLVALTKARKQQTYVILSYVNEVVTRYESAPDDQKLPREKEGALRMIGSLSSVILGKKSPIADHVEYFFVRHVFPEFRSPHGFLRARACDTLEKFEQLDFKDPNNLMVIYRNILESMADPELPVRVMASLALQPLIRHDVIRTAMQANIPQIMHQLLKLANEVDVDALANVMEDFVEVFSEQLTPFAVALSEQLRDTYLRIIRELLERNDTKAMANGDVPEYGEYLDDKSIAALGVLQTIGTLILTLEASPDVLLHLETILMPVIQTTLENKLYDLYNEVFEIVDSCTFASKAISETMWHAFELMHKTFKEGAELYLEDMLPALDNFITYGRARLIQHPPYLVGIVGMVKDIFGDPKVGGVDRICGCKLAEALMLNLRGGAVTPFIEEFISLAMETLTNSKTPLIKSYKIHLVEMVVNAIYYDPVLALRVLETRGWTNKFFSIWFGMIDTFRRVHDKKLCIAAISALLTIPAGQVPQSVQTGWPRLLTGATYLFRTLPAALKHREEAVKSSDLGDDLGGDDDYASDDADDWADEEQQQHEWGNVNAADVADTKGDVKDESQSYLDFLSEEAKKFGALDDDDEDSVMDEDSMLESALDKFDPYETFKLSMLTLQQGQPALYQQLTGVLEQGDREVLQSVMQHQPQAPPQIQ